jgi:hypothetical protein
MSLKEERLQILKMLEEGKITAEEAATLLSALEAGAQKEQGEAKSTSASGAPRRRRVRICVSDGATGKKKVDINFPIGVIKFARRMGTKFTGNIEGINLDDIFDAVHQEVEGKIIDIQDEYEGKRVEIFVE